VCFFFPSSHPIPQKKTLEVLVVGNWVVVVWVHVAWVVPVVLAGACLVAGLVGAPKGSLLGGSSQFVSVVRINPMPFISQNEAMNGRGTEQPDP